jgi:hypothetical protein
MFMGKPQPFNNAFLCNPVSYLLDMLSTGPESTIDYPYILFRWTSVFLPGFAQYWPERYLDCIRTLLQVLPPDFHPDFQAELNQRKLRSVEQGDISDHLIVVMFHHPEHKGVIQRLYVERKHLFTSGKNTWEVASPDSLAASRESFKNAIESVAQLIRGTRQTADLIQWGTFIFQLDLPPGMKTDDFPIAGESLGLAGALAFFGMVAGKAVPKWVAATGRIEDGQVLGVDFVDEKISALLREFPSISKILIPTENYETITAVFSDPNIISKIKPVGTLAEAISEVFGQDPADIPLSPDFFPDSKVLFQKAQNDLGQRYQLDDALRRLGQVVFSLEQEEKQHQNCDYDLWLDCRKLQIAVYNHLGDPENALRHLDLWVEKYNEANAQDILPGGLDKAKIHFYEIENLRSVKWTDLFQYPEAERILLKTLSSIDSRDLHYGYCQRTLGQLYIFWKRFAEAEQAFAAAMVNLKKTNQYGDYPRQYTYQAALYIRWAHHQQTSADNFLMQQADDNVSLALAESEKQGIPFTVLCYTLLQKVSLSYVRRAFSICTEQAETILQDPRLAGIRNYHYPVFLIRKLKAMAYWQLGNLGEAKTGYIQALEYATHQNSVVHELMKTDALLSLAEIEHGSYKSIELARRTKAILFRFHQSIHAAAHTHEIGRAELPFEKTQKHLEHYLSTDGQAIDELKKARQNFNSCYQYL